MFLTIGLVSLLWVIGLILFALGMSIAASVVWFLVPVALILAMLCHKTRRNLKNHRSPRL